MPINYATECYFITLALCGFLHIILALHVVKLRRSYQIRIGHSNNNQLHAAIRAHGNFCEYAPISLLLLGTIAFLDNDLDLIFGLCFAFLLARLLHIASILHFETAPTPTIRYRQIGIGLNVFIILFASGHILLEMLSNAFNSF